MRIDLMPRSTLTHVLLGPYSPLHPKFGSYTLPETGVTDI